MHNWVECSTSHLSNVRVTWKCSRCGWIVNDMSDKIWRPSDTMIVNISERGHQGTCEERQIYLIHQS